MRLTVILLGILFGLALAPLFAQEIRLPASLEQSAAKAEESVDITLDSHLLKLASQLVASDDKEESKARKALAGLESITVRNYQFSSEGEYNPADLEGVRAQFKMPDWSRILGVKSKNGDNADVYLKVREDGTIGGVAILAAEPREFTVVSITGKLDLAQLCDLGGKYHIPEFDLGTLTRARGNK